MAAKRNKVIISCAVTGAVHIPSQSEYLPITPEQILASAGIDDARQAEYQRKMSALLAGRS